MHWDQNIIFIIIAAIVGISRLIAKISEESKKQKRPPQPPRPLGQPRPEYTQPVHRIDSTAAEHYKSFGPGCVRSTRLNGGVAERLKAAVC